jgi:hypothetical protein
MEVQLHAFLNSVPGGGGGDSGAYNDDDDIYQNFMMLMDLLIRDN